MIKKYNLIWYALLIMNFLFCLSIIIFSNNHNEQIDITSFPVNYRGIMLLTLIFTINCILLLFIMNKKLLSLMFLNLVLLLLYIFYDNEIIINSYTYTNEIIIIITQFISCITYCILNIKNRIKN